MNAVTPAAYDPSTFDHAAFHELLPGVPDEQRYDGWVPEKQKRFLIALARGLSVTKACAIVRLSRQSAYALRDSARGAAFALGWNAAQLRARDVLADELMDRALNGVRETVTDDDGRVTTRHRQDNNLAWRMLSRLDRRADAACTETGAAAARLAAADFEQLLDLIGRDAAPARAGLFLAARIDRAGMEATPDDLAPIRALARADRWLRTRVDEAQPLDTADLDPADRARWTGEQWARAEAAGLVQLAPPEPAAPDTPPDCQLRQPGQGADAMPDPDNPDDEPVWWDSGEERWLTRFPPPDHYFGHEEGEYGDAGYWRTLDADEVVAVEAPGRAQTEASLPAVNAAREAWFAARLAEAEALRAAAPSALQTSLPASEGQGAGARASTRRRTTH
ncbi:hypothetical protein M9978_00290 [Sphingomonas sp. MG17]|uniref:Uncharacterized protein n=1 Tax=Sphingomonas tagetis TaxID=2949092 RepID=A0A9X2HHD1_9SPHN|nr:hypothetical protein [Sphingomonas tagetis]MCP3728856.1 hypothetical protein [Sphingomonas tagetis]